MLAYSEARARLQLQMLRQLSAGLSVERPQPPGRKRPRSNESESRCDGDVHVDVLLVPATHLKIEGPHLPYFALELVLEYLVPRQLCRASCVCSAWRCINPSGDFGRGRQRESYEFGESNEYHVSKSCTLFNWNFYCLPRVVQ
jgi:hypothetical protein